jgi:hypothetical protein
MSKFLGTKGQTIMDCGATKDIGGLVPSISEYGFIGYRVIADGIS